MHTESEGHDRVPRFVLDLDAPARLRWRHIVEKFIPQMERLKAFIQKTEVDEFGALGPWFAYFMRLGFSAAWKLLLTPEMSEELEGIADVTSAYGLDYWNLLLLNIGYDLVARCTSLVVEDATMSPCLLRNMDWESPVFHSTTIEVEFQSKGSPIYTGTTWVGFVGLLTGMRHRHAAATGYAVTLNFRQLDPSLAGYFKPLWGIACRRWPAAVLIRHTLATALSYQEAVEAFRTTALVAPCYLTVAGSLPGEGIVLTRNAHTDERALTLQGQGGPIVQTNIDHWVVAVDEQWAAGDPLLLNAVARRARAHQALSSLGGPYSPDRDGFSILEEAPVMNELTIYSCIICPASGLYRTKLQFPPGHPMSHHTGRVHKLVDSLQHAADPQHHHH